MQNALKKRKRRVDLDNMAPEDIDNASLALGKKIGVICDKYAKIIEDEVNSLAEIYSVKAKVQIAFVDPKTGEFLTP